MEESAPVGVHLVGSVPLGSAEEVFRSVAGAIGDRLRRLPDGETGARSDWIVWQYPLFSSRPQFEMGPPGASSYRALPQLRLRTGVDASGLAFEELGYASAAIASYATFARLKRDGAIPRGLPLPRLAADAARAGQRVRGARGPGRARAGLRGADARRGRAHPRGDPGRPARDPVGRPLRVRDAGGRDRGLVRRRARPASSSGCCGSASLVPAGVELGYHLCYGDDEHGHFAEPEDAGKLVAVANALARLGAR